jgi:Acyl-protein synthetase, LuxE
MQIQSGHYLSSMTLPASPVPSVVTQIFDFIQACSARPWVGSSEASTESDADFNALCCQLFQYQTEHNLAYRRWCASRGALNREIVNWTEIPCVPTSSFKEIEWTCLQPQDRNRVFHSSRTTEQRPSRHFHSDRSIELYEASLIPGFERHLMADRDARVGAGQTGVPDRPRMLFLTPPSHSAPHSSLSHMLECVQRRFASPESSFIGKVDDAGTWVLDRVQTLAVLKEAMVANQPLWIFGTAFNVVHLLDFMAEQKLRYRLATGSRVMETGGYKGRSRVLAKADLHSLITLHLGIPDTHIVCEYGMSELSSQAYDRVVRIGSVAWLPPRRFQFPPWVRARIVSPETGREVAVGEMGMVRILDLANAYSVLAVQTEDLGRRWEDGFELTGRASASESRGCSLMSGEV